MHLFTYWVDNRPAAGRQVGALGVDIRLVVEAYCREYPHACEELGVMPASLLEWVQKGSEGMHLIRKATDWILDSYAKKDESKWLKGIVFEFDSVSLLAPIPTPGKVICIAGNYPAAGKLEKPAYPTVFLKPSSGVIGDGQNVIIPALAENVAYEVELAVIIGKQARNVSPDAALEHVAGYTLANDMGDRVLEKRTSQWTSGKMFDTFTPMGPVLITPDELYGVKSLEMTTRVNNQPVQHGNIDQMFFDVPNLVSLLSELTTLQPGDVILSGSPKLMGDSPNPVVAIKPGDVVEVSIEKLGTLTNTAVAEEEDSK